MDEHFDESEVLDLIQSVIEDRNEPQALDVAPSLGLYEARVLGWLPSILASYDVSNANVANILKDIRLYIAEAHGGGESIADLHSIVKNCRKCPLVQPSPYLPSWNTKDPSVLLVAPNPKITSETSDFLTSSLKGAGFSSADVCITYAVRCKSKDKDTKVEIANCSGYLYREIEALSPKLVITFGAQGAAPLFGSDTLKLSSIRGEIIWLGSQAIMPTYSPAYALRSSESKAQDFQADLQKAYDFALGTNNGL